MCFAAEIGLNFYSVCLKITWLVGNLIFLSGPLSEDREANCALTHGNMKHLLNALLDGAFSTLAPENRMHANVGSANHYHNSLGIVAL